MNFQMHFFLLKEKTFKANIKEQLLVLLEDLLMITLYVVLLYVIVLTGRDKMEYLSNKETVELITGIHSRSTKLDDVEIIEE